MQWIQDLTDFIFLSDPPQQADLLFLPGNGHAEPAEYAAKLYLQGWIPRILPSGRYSIRRGAFSGQTSGTRIYSGSFETEWAFMHHILLENGVPDSAILREDQATYTYENALRSRALTNALGLTVRKALLVCQPMHARRARTYYELAFPETEILVCPAPGMDITRENWLSTEEGIHKVLGEVERCGNQFHEILCRHQGISMTLVHSIP
ncbi:MAG: YdcF family protein [Clostridia bacterium]|nr:YdcF family protein [Clostridia bacterium]